MLWNVPNQLNRLARNVVRNHPNTFNCEIFRKHTLREADDEAAGKPTFGGMGVIDSGDEEDYSYEYMGNGYALPAETFQPAPMVDALDANIGASGEFRFLIELEAQASDDDYFDLKNHDVGYLLLGEHPDCAKLAYEIVTMETVSNIPPFAVRYVCHRRDELDIAARRKVKS